MQKRTLFLVAVVFAAVASTNCAVRAVKSTETGDPKAEKRVLIATQRSEFKEAVVSRVVQELERDMCYVKVIDLKRLEEEPAGSYDAVVVVNTCKAWSLSGRASRFVKQFPDKKRVVLLTTAGGEGWKPGALGVDAITSASKAYKVDPVADEIFGKVRKILNPDRAP
jgi:hypothetical protein